MLCTPAILNTSSESAHTGLCSYVNYPGPGMSCMFLLARIHSTMQTNDCITVLYSSVSNWSN